MCVTIKGNPQVFAKNILENKIRYHGNQAAMRRIYDKNMVEEKIIYANDRLVTETIDKKTISFRQCSTLVSTSKETNSLIY